MFELFVSSDPLDTRFLWDPTVHKDNSEDLYFYLIQSRALPMAVAARIRGAAETLYLPALCVYSLYGQSDLLLRVWLGAEDKRSFEVELDQIVGQDQWQRFSVEKSFYDDWSQHPVDNHYSKRRPFQEQISTLARPSPDFQLGQAALKGLLHARLVHRMSPRLIFGPTFRGTLTKCYIFLSRETALDRGESEENRQVLQVIAGLPELKLKSVYFGYGAGFSYIVKGVVEAQHLADVDYWIDRCITELNSKQLAFRSRTAVVGRTHGSECDALDIERNDLSREGRLLQRIRPDLTKLMRTESGELVTRGCDIFGNAFAEFENTQFEELLLQAVGAYFNRDWPKFCTACYFAILYEGYLDDYLRTRLLPSSLGTKKWFVRVRQLAPEIADRPDQNSRMSFGTWVRVLRTLNDSKEVDVTAALGADWNSRLDLVKKLRDKTAHPNRGNAPKDDHAWAELLQLAVDVGRAWLAIVPLSPTRP